MTNTSNNDSASASVSTDFMALYKCCYHHYYYYKVTSQAQPQTCATFYLVALQPIRFVFLSCLWHYDL